jgi:hypothetical protein
MSLFIVAGPSNVTDVTPQVIAPSTDENELLWYIIATIAGQGTEDATMSNQTDPGVDDSKSIAFDIPPEEEISEPIAEPLIKFDGISEDVENKINEKCSILRYIILRWQGMKEKEAMVEEVAVPQQQSTARPATVVTSKPN